jgi:hypothetical protein
VNFGETLGHFKKIESAESIIPLVDDESLRGAVVAWKSVVIKYIDASDCGEKNEAAQWNWLWTKVEFDLTSYGVVAGLKPQEVRNVFLRIAGLRLIYPDGTINTYAAKFLQALIMAKLPKPPKQPAAPKA